MPYIGNPPANRFVTPPEVQRFNGDNSTTEFTLANTIGADQDILVSVDGVIQDTTSYSVNDKTLTFTTAPSSGTNNIFVFTISPLVASINHPATSPLNATSGTFSGALSTSGAFTSLGIDDNADSNAITIDSSENVAIGSTDPQGFQLQVNSGVAGNIARFTDGVNANAVIKTSGSTTTFGPDTTNSLVLQTNSVERVNINTSGLAQFKSSGIGAGSQVFQVIDDGATLFQIRAEDGNISFPQSGAGIYLGVTAGNSANLLDHYETGSWTPTLSSSGATFSYSFNGGHYVRVGDMVTCLARITSNATPTGTTGNALFIAGLPFTIYNQSDLYSGDTLGHFISYNIPSGYTNATLQYQQNSTTVILNFTGDNVGESTAAASAVSSSTQFRFRLTYRTA